MVHSEIKGTYLVGGGKITLIFAIFKKKLIRNYVMLRNLYKE